MPVSFHRRAYAPFMEHIEKSAADHWVAMGSPFVTNLGGRPIPTDNQLIVEYMTNDIVYTCVNWNASTVAGAPFKLYALDGAAKAYASKAVDRAALRGPAANVNLANRIHAGHSLVELLDHPLLDLLEKDNDGLNGYQLRYMTATYMEVLGGAYWLMENDGVGRVGGVKVLPTQRVLPLRDRDLGVVGYKYLEALQGRWLTLAKPDVLDFRFPAVEDPYGGRHAPLKSAYMQAELATKFSLYQNSLMDNRARVDGIFIPKDHIGKSEAQRAEEMFQSKFRGAGNGRVMVAEAAGQFVPVAYPPTDLGPLEISRETLRRLCNAFGVPEALLSKDATYANMRAAMANYMKHTIVPRILILEQKLNEMLVPRFGEGLFLAAENPSAEDQAFALQRAQVAIGAGVLGKSEIRVATGFSPRLPEEDEIRDTQVAAERQTETPAEPVAPVAPSAAEKQFPSPPPSEAISLAVDANGPNDGASIDSNLSHIAMLLRINRAVAKGDLERAIAINMAQDVLRLSGEQARALVGHRRKQTRFRAELSPPAAIDPASKPTTLSDPLVPIDQPSEPDHESTNNLGEPSDASQSPVAVPAGDDLASPDIADEPTDHPENV